MIKILLNLIQYCKNNQLTGDFLVRNTEKLSILGVKE